MFHSPFPHFLRSFPRTKPPMSRFQSTDISHPIGNESRDRNQKLNLGKEKEKSNENKVRSCILPNVSRPEKPMSRRIRYLGNSTGLQPTFNARCMSHRSEVPLFHEECKRVFVFVMFQLRIEK